MSDIVERLRDWRGDPDEVMADAADEIERLRAALSAPAPAPAAEAVATVGDLIIQVRERVVAKGIKNNAPLYAAPAAPAGWQPIETAPDDMGAHLFRVNGIAVQGFRDATGIMCVQNERHEWRKMRGEPTHWMPLPAAPGAQVDA